jgi:hypothetical protein
MSTIVDGRKVTLDELTTMAKDAKGSISALYLHWSAGHYNQVWEDYHINIDDAGNIFVTCDDLTELKAHTWRRNSGAIGIALDCCVGATTNDLGEEAPTEAQIESMAQVIAVLCKNLELICCYDNVKTHGECADEDEYGLDDSDPQVRWDLHILHNGDEMRSGGNTLRGKAIWYMEN